MNKFLRFGLLILSLQLSVWAQSNLSQTSKIELSKAVPTRYIQAPDLSAIRAEDDLRDKQGMLYRIGVAVQTNINPNQEGAWINQPDGSRVWQIIISAPGAEAISYLFEHFVLYGGSTLRIQNLYGQDVHPILTSQDVESHQMQNAALCAGATHVLTLTEPAYTTPSEIFIDRVMYNYRSTGYGSTEKINESDPCEVNVNCSPVGDAWQNQKRGVARVYVVEGSQAGWCSGSLINNTAQDCKPYLLTALHCGVNSTAANMNQWKFYFGYEAPTCTNPTTVGSLASHFITGCLRIADSNDGGGNSGSDFLLVKMGNNTNESTVVTNLKSAAFNAYWNGWNASPSPTTGGASIHHPSGDIKKISTFSGNTISTQWGSATGSHWRVTWTANANGHGVTEGGSSGSPLFDAAAGNIIGTLTGGASYCTSLSAPDQYGKMAFHWTNNGTPAAEQLKPWLDPANLNVLVFGGSADPCTPTTPVAPTANFTANTTNITPGTTVSFTDLSLGLPTSWSWTVSPATGWSFAGGTTATSQNPQITFNNIGQYTITLTASNAQGSDDEIKNNYIVVAQLTGPCTASGVCDEYINTVSFNTINNTSACGNNGYTDFTNTSTSLAQGSTYTLTITPGIIGSTSSAYSNDEIAAWIDYNNDFDFDDAGEQVAYVLVANGWNNVFNVTVPLASYTGNVRMRVRISYQPDGAITPCGPASYGETEDYTINLTSGAGISDNPLAAVQIYPNPANELLYIDLKDLKNIQNIAIFDMNGKQIQTITDIQAGINTMQIDHIQAGMYQVRIQQDGYQYTQRLIKL